QQSILREATRNGSLRGGTPVFAPQQLEKLHEALLDAFDVESLKRMLRFRLGLKLQDLSLARNFTQVVFDVLDRAEQCGWTYQFVMAAYKVEPRNPKLHAFCEAEAQFALSPQEPAALAKATREGLLALAELLTNVRVRAAVTLYQRDFQTSQTTIETL